MDIFYPKMPPPQKRNIKQEIWRPLDKVPAHVDKIHFDGVTRTKDDILQHVVSDLRSAQTVQDVFLKAHAVRQQLKNLNIFKSIDTIIDTSKGPNANPGGIEVIFKVKEKGLKTKFTGNNENNFNISLMTPNVFVSGESLSADFESGRKTAGFHIGTSKPFLNWGKRRLNQFGFGRTDNTACNGFQEKLSGIGTKYTFKYFPLVQHSLGWKGEWRNIKCLSPNTPFEVREDAGHSVKSSLYHMLCVDQRDNFFFPSNGCYFHLHQEYAGLGGDVDFLRHEIHYQISKCILGGLVLRSNLKGGSIRSTRKDSKVRINDKYFLDGTFSLRGFDFNSVGPRPLECSIGSKDYWACGLHAFVPLPFQLGQTLGQMVMIHFFLDGGNAGDFAVTGDYHHNGCIFSFKVVLWLWFNI